MREIKFRGQRIDTKEWVYGWIITNKLGTYIITEKNPHECTLYGYLEIDQYYRVIPETVGQYTGLHGKSGKEIYEGDVLKDVDTGKIKQMIYNAPSFVLRDEKAYFYWTYHADEYEVIGNIYENPKLLKETDTK